MVVVPLLLAGSIVLLVMVLTRSRTWTAMAATMRDAGDRISAENEIFRTLAQIFGGGFVLAGIYFSAKSVLISRQSHTDDRLSSALENLGADGIPERIGGVATLGALLRSANADVELITTTLCGYIQTETNSDDYLSDAARLSKPRPDIQAALWALGRRRTSFGPLHGERRPLNLRECFLNGADFADGDFHGADFSQSKLNNASFFRTHLRGAKFTECSLSSADFNQADLRGATYFRAVAPHARFRRAFIRGTIFVRCSLVAASFEGTDLKGVEFASACLEQADFGQSALHDCNFAHATGVDLTGAERRNVLGVT
jgi:uncharacterized protein YjbI with pentapeptide repeats